MKLTTKDKELLINWGYPENDFKQIEEAIKITTYKLEDDKKISRKRALEILGKCEYLSGIARSAFHWSSCRSNEEGKTVYFDSSKLFQ